MFYNQFRFALLLSFVAALSLSLITTASAVEPTVDTFQLAQATPSPPPGIGGARMSAAAITYVDKINNYFRDNGLTERLPHQLIAPSCENCAPYIINCKNEISALSDLVNVSTRVSGASKAMVEENGGIPRMLPGGEVNLALDGDLIECAVFGGMPAE